MKMLNLEREIVVSLITKFHFHLQPNFNWDVQKDQQQPMSINDIM